MTKYNIYQNGIKILENVPVSEANQHTGITNDRIAYYINTGKVYHGKKGEFTFDYPDSEVMRYMPQELADKWERMRIAAKLIKTGHGHIVTKGGKKYVEAPL